MKAHPEWRRFEWLALTLLLLGAAQARVAAEYRTVEVEGLRVTVDSDWPSSTAPGYLPVRVDLTNLGEARVIEILGQGSRFFMRAGGQGSLLVRQTVRLARGDRVRLTIPVPVYADNENIRFELRENGRPLEQFNYSGFQSGKSPGDASALIVLDPGSGFATLAAGWARPIPVPAGYAFTAPGVAVTAGGTSMPLLDLLLDPSRLPSNWLGFTSLRTVLIGPQGWERLNDAQKSALRAWTACGGDLMFVDGGLQAIFPNAEGRPSLSADGRFAPYFFGQIHFPTSAAVDAAGLAATLAAIEPPIDDAIWALPVNRAPEWGRIIERGFQLPIPGVAGIPARAYLSILIVFSLLIGPVNYVFLRRRRQQVLLVLTAPLIAALFIVLLGAYVIAGEGFGVRGRAISFTRLDQTRRQAATRASVSLYAAGMTPSGGLSFPRDVAVFPIGPDGRGRRDSQTLDLTEAQRFSSGLIRARAPSNFEVVGFRPARERLTFRREGGRTIVVNGLGVTVTRLAYREGDTAHILGAPLASGGKAVLTTGARRRTDIIPAGQLLPPRLNAIVDNQPDGSYVAILERSPFWEPGVTGIDERGSFHLVLGSGGFEP